MASPAPPATTVQLFSLTAFCRRHRTLSAYGIENRRPAVALTLHQSSSAYRSFCGEPVVRPLYITDTSICSYPAPEAEYPSTKAMRGTGHTSRSLRASFFEASFFDCVFAVCTTVTPRRVHYTYKFSHYSCFALIPSLPISDFSSDPGSRPSSPADEQENWKITSDFQTSPRTNPLRQFLVALSGLIPHASTCEPATGTGRFCGMLTLSDSLGCTGRLRRPQASISRQPSLLMRCSQELHYPKTKRLH